jgi:hypothetical protein
MLDFFAIPFITVCLLEKISNPCMVIKKSMSTQGELCMSENTIKKETQPEAHVPPREAVIAKLALFAS